jgi:undecaprenyl pyrophosphate phosphatase UppP
MASGLAALWLLRRAVTGGRLHFFAYYCWLAGLAVLLFVR